MLRRCWPPSLAGNDPAELVWLDQRLDDADVQVVGDTVAVLTAVATDVVSRAQDAERAGDVETFRLRLTKTWVPGPEGWQCLSGHPGPRLPRNGA